MIYNLHCSNKCKQEGNALAERHIIKVSLFEQTEYNEETIKKKLMFVDNHVATFEFNNLLKEKMKNIEYTSNTYNHAINKLNETAIINVQDISENYTCLLP